jgi:hypothetical protein
MLTVSFTRMPTLFWVKTRRKFAKWVPKVNF